jgi:hypothetical protein
MQSRRVTRSGDTVVTTEMSGKGIVGAVTTEDVLDDLRALTEVKNNG